MPLTFERLLKRRIAIWGYGREGQAALAAIRRYMPEKRLTLLIDPEEADQWDFSSDLFLEVVTEPAEAGVLGQYQYIFKSPGIPPYDPKFDWARFRGTRFVSGTQLWFAHHANDRTLCVTGTKGKSTTTALIAHLLRALHVRTALAGNIGLPLLDLLEPEVPPEWWVIELSSFQAADFDGVPAVAVVLNLFPEHLDWHGDAERYYRDKLNVFADGKVDVAVINAADPTLAALLPPLKQVIRFNDPSWWHVRDDAIHRGEQRVLPVSEIPLRGAHNHSNVCAALAAIEATGNDAIQAAAHVKDFRPLPHRLQRLGHRHGLDWYDDSIATTPEATIAALDALQENGVPVTVIVGGYDRGLDWDGFAQHVLRAPPHAVICQGANGPRIAETLRSSVIKAVSTAAIGNAAGAAAPQRLALVEVESLEHAVERAKQITPRGGIVLLSPGAPSFDQFSSYAERGAVFADLGGFDGDKLGEIEGLGIA